MEVVIVSKILFINSKLFNMVSTKNIFLFPGVRCTHVIEPSEIIYLQAESNYTHVFMSNGNHQFFSKTLKHLEAYLPETFFLRTHQSFVVNKSYIKVIKSDSVTLNDNTDIPVSRRKKKSIKLEFLKQF
jgi:two-component system, LytTR family, response regulator